MTTSGLRKKKRAAAAGEEGGDGGGALFPPLAVATTYRKSVRRSVAVWKLINWLRGWLKKVETENRVTSHP